MIAALFEILFEIAGDVLLQFLFGMLFDVGFMGVEHATRKRKERGIGTAAGDQTSLLLALVGFVVLGALCGWVSVLAVPHRVLPPPRMPGLSMLLSPLGTGAAMHLYGRWRRRQGRDQSRLTTFVGGAVFALAFAATRYILLRQGP
jgi:hypothetical protein